MIKLIKCIFSPNEFQTCIIWGMKERKCFYYRSSIKPEHFKRIHSILEGRYILNVLQVTLLMEKVRNCELGIVGMTDLPTSLGGVSFKMYRTYFTSVRQCI